MANAAPKILIVCGLLSAVAAHPTSLVPCPPPEDPEGWARETLQSAATVFAGRIVSIAAAPHEIQQQPAETDGNTPSSTTAGQSAASMQELLTRIEQGQARQQTERFDYIVSFEVIQAWKTPMLPVVRMKVRGAFNLFARSTDDTYLVVGHEPHDEFYWLRGGCGNILRGSESGPFVAALNTLATPR